MATCVLSLSMMAQDIKLPEPQRTGGMPLMEALANRKSTREFDSSKHLSQQQLSNMLWAAWGLNRLDKHTAPTGMNRQEISVYIIIPEAAYKYSPENNTLVLVNKGDFRKQASKQEFAEKANLNVVIVSDIAKQSNETYAGVAQGAVMQNIYLWCASEGVGAVVRAGFDGDALAKALKLNADEKVFLVQTVGK